MNRTRSGITDTLGVHRGSFRIFARASLPEWMLLTPRCLCSGYRQAPPLPLTANNSSLPLALPIAPPVSPPAQMQVSPALLLPRVRVGGVAAWEAIPPGVRGSGRRGAAAPLSFLSGSGLMPNQLPSVIAAIGVGLTTPHQGVSRPKVQSDQFLLWSLSVMRPQ